MTCSLKSQIENNKDETSPNISWGMDKYLHVQIVYAHKDLLSALLHNESLNDQVSLEDSESVVNEYKVANLNENINDPIENVFYNINSNSDVPKLPNIKTEVMPASLRSTQMRMDNFDKAIVKHPHSLYTIKQTYKLQSDPLLYNSETCQSVCLYVCLCQFLRKQTYELQSDSLLYNGETCQSVCLYVCPCHFFSRPAVTQHSMRLEENPIPENQI